MPYGTTSEIIGVEELLVNERGRRVGTTPHRNHNMKQITMDDLNPVMELWKEFARGSGLMQDIWSETYILAEKAWIYAYLCQTLEITPMELESNAIPPAIAMCFVSSRPVMSLGNWNDPETGGDLRLRDASITWADRVRMFPRTGGEE